MEGNETIGSEEMTVSEMVNQAIAIKGVSKKEVAAQMGWSPQNFNGKLKNDTITGREWLKLADILGYTVQMVDNGSKKTIRQRRPSSGGRVTQMVDGFTYDTDKADALCKTPKVLGGWFELFKVMGENRFFTVAYHEIGKSACLATISEADAREFYDMCDGTEVSEYFSDEGEE